MFFMILNVIFWFLDHQNHVGSNLLRPAALLSLADWPGMIQNASAARSQVAAGSECCQFACIAPAMIQVDTGHKKDQTSQEPWGLNGTCQSFPKKT